MALSLLFLFALHSTSASYLDKKETKGGVFGWFNALGKLKKYKIKFLGIQSNGKDIDIDEIVKDVVPNLVTYSNLTQIIYDNLGKLTNPEAQSFHILSNDNAETNNNFENFKKYFGDFGITKYVTVETANNAIGSIWGYVNSCLTVLIFFCIVFVLFIVNFIGCCCCCKAKNHDDPSCKGKMCFSITSSLILISAVFFIMSISSLKNVKTVIEKLDTEILSDIFKQLSGDLENIFSMNTSNPNSIYSTFLPSIRCIQANVSLIGDTMTEKADEIMENATMINATAYSIMNIIEVIKNDDIPEVNTAYQAATGESGTLSLNFNFNDLQQGLDDSLSDVKQLETEIKSYTTMVDEIDTKLNDVLDTFLKLHDNQAKSILDYAKKHSSNLDKTYTDGFRYYLQVYRDNFNLIQGLYIALGVILILSIFIYYFCFCTFCSLSRCCSSTPSIFPLIWSIIMVFLGFVLTFIGLICLYAGSVFENLLDNGVSEIVTVYFPDNKLIFPTLYIGPYTKYLINSSIDITWNVQPNMLEIFNNLNVVDGTYDIVDLFGISNAFNLSGLSNQLYDYIYNISQDFVLPVLVMEKLNNAVHSLETNNDIKDSIDEYQQGGENSFSDQINSMLARIDSIVSGNPEDISAAKEKLNKLKEKLDSVSLQYSTMATDIHINIPKNYMTAAGYVQTSIRTAINNVGITLLHAIPLIYNLINEISAKQLVKYYPALKNPIAYDIPYIGANLSLSAHLVFIGFFSLVIVMWIRRKDQLSNSKKKRSGSSYSSDSSDSYSQPKPVRARTRMSNKKKNSSSSSTFSSKHESGQNKKQDSSSYSSSSFDSDRNASKAMIF
ncbi:hypothetical protein TRFO_36702 [Tritrichomonas foetus]|uniref:Prominin n=1 Tax=Tritrichomonas foetus TaxID=1144522 RepID=A0A1J4JEQ4_9EUKA|nr:hypothetical protein TRFO_36702 [Tritrichomonas foetus]|eukprot:OHS97145.1 hypothetical protein TRFO_36702 [Tritrichomonas foetus]